MNLLMLLEMAASGFGERTALVNETERMSYAQLFAAAGGAARALRETGAQRVAVLDVNSLAVPVGLFGSACAGLPFAPLSYRLATGEIEQLARQLAPAVLVTDAQRAPQLGHLEGIEVWSREDFLARSRASDAPPEEWPMDPEAAAVWLFTSGTTGPPKAALLRHRHLVSYILGSVEFGSAAEEDAGLVSVPPYHVAAVAAILSSIYSTRRMVQLPSFDAARWLETARRERVTNAFVVPTMLARIVETLEQTGAAAPPLRALSYGGGKMPLPVIERAMRLFPETGFTNAYGLTETSSTISLLGPEEHRQALASQDPKARRRLVSAGRPLPSVEVEVRDPEGKALPPGQTGEIHVRGEQVSGEYLGRGSQLGPDGFFPTRDGGSLDEEGYLFVEGRIDDIIVRGGENLSPGEIEDVMRLHEAVADAAVVGLPDEQWGEAVAAMVVLAPGRAADAEGLQSFVRSRLRSSRTPERIVFQAELPYNETGKLLRRRVRDALLEDGS